MSFYPRPKQLYQGQLTALSATLYTAPSAQTTPGDTQKTIVKEIIVCNTDTAARTYTLNIVPSAGTASAANEIFGGMSIAANTTVVYRFSMVMEGGSTLRGLADVTSKITLTASGVELI